MAEQPATDVTNHDQVHDQAKVETVPDRLPKWRIRVRDHFQAVPNEFFRAQDLSFTDAGELLDWLEFEGHPRPIPQLQENGLLTIVVPPLFAPPTAPSEI